MRLGKLHHMMNYNFHSIDPGNRLDNHQCILRIRLYKNKCNRTDRTEDTV